MKTLAVVLAYALIVTPAASVHAKADDAALDVPGVGAVRFEVWELSTLPESQQASVVYQVDFKDRKGWRPSGRAQNCVMFAETNRTFVSLGGKNKVGFPHGVKSDTPVAVPSGGLYKLSFDGRRVDAAGSFLVYLRLFDSCGKDVTRAIKQSGWGYSDGSCALLHRIDMFGKIGEWEQMKCTFILPDCVAAVEPFICPWRGEHVDCSALRLTMHSDLRGRRIPLAVTKRSDDFFNATSAADSLSLAVDVKAKDGAYEIRAMVSDLSQPPRPRALNVVADVQRDLTGWLWHGGWRADNKIESALVFRNVELLGAIPVSRYPFTAVSKDGRGFAFGTPFDEPAFESRVTTAHGVRSTTAIGLLVRGVDGHGTQATLRWTAFPFAGTWGFRSAAAVYYKAMAHTFPPSHAGEKEGTWLWPVWPSKTPDNPDDFGLTFWEAPATAGCKTNEVAAAHARGIGAYPYTEVLGMRQPLKTFPDGSHPPVEERLAELKSWAADADTKLRWFAAPRHIAAQAALNSLPVQPDGTHPFTVEKYDNWAQWWKTNPDPRIGRPNRAALCWDYTIGPGMDIVDGVYLDSMSYMSFTIDYRNVRPEHLAVMTENLVYDGETGRPCADGIQHQRAFVSWLAGILHAKGKRIFANGAGITHRFNATLIDIFGHEVGGFGRRPLIEVPEPEYLALEKRFYAYHRPVSNLLQEGSFKNPVSELTAGDVRRYVEHQMFYGFYPGISTIGGEKKAGYKNWRRYFDATRACERDRALFKKAIPVIRRLNRAGWEPETMMRSRTKGVIVERYGTPGAGDCLFTVRNTSTQSVDTVLAPECKVSFAPVWNGAGLSSQADETWRLPLSPGETVVLAVE